MSDETRDETGQDKRDDVMVEQDHPQTRKAEPNARGSSEWRDDVVPPAGKSREDGDGRKVSELAEDAERTRRQAFGGGSRDSIGGDRSSSE